MNVNGYRMPVRAAKTRSLLLILLMVDKRYPTCVQWEGMNGLMVRSGARFSNYAFFFFPNFFWLAGSAAFSPAECSE